MENQWLSYAKRLEAIGQTGLAYCKFEFERERLEEISAISRRMMAQLMSTPIEKMEDDIGRAFRFEAARGATIFD